MNYLPWQAKNQDEFIYIAFNYYRVKTNSFMEYCIYSPIYVEHIIFWLYKLGRDYRVLFIDYDEFKRVILGKHKDYNSNGIIYKVNKKYLKYLRNKYYYYDYSSYRVLKGFTYTGQSKKDSPSKNEWRECKRFASDSSKSRYNNPWKKSFKYANKRKHRQLERQAISNKKYDKLHRWSYKQAEDPWGWD